MTLFVYRCPNTGKKVQGRTDDPPVADDLDAYQSVECNACSQLHWVNPMMVAEIFMARLEAEARLMEDRLPSSTSAFVPFKQHDQLASKEAGLKAGKVSTTSSSSRNCRAARAKRPDGQH
jgi:hypothetical protein